MDHQQPKTRQESKKNQRCKGRPDQLGSQKHIRQTEALLAKRATQKQEKPR
jgi:hypothetical protein